jgi:hypothetical protein
MRFLLLILGVSVYVVAIGTRAEAQPAAARIAVS